MLFSGSRLMICWLWQSLKEWCLTGSTPCPWVKVRHRLQLVWSKKVFERWEFTFVSVQCVQRGIQRQNQNNQNSYFLYWTIFFKTGAFYARFKKSFISGFWGFVIMSFEQSRNDWMIELSKFIFTPTVIRDILKWNEFIKKNWKSCSTVFSVIVRKITMVLVCHYVLNIFIISG